LECSASTCHLILWDAAGLDEVLLEVVLAGAVLLGLAPQLTAAMPGPPALGLGFAAAGPCNRHAAPILDQSQRLSTCDRSSFYLGRAILEFCA
jgi:hypothetical protein